MGRHVEASGTTLDLRRTAQIAGLAGGIGWVLASFLGDGAVKDALLWSGAVLLTASLLGLGLLLVRSGFLALRLFIAVAVPVLVWGVFGIVHQSMSDPGLVDVVFGALVGLICAVRLGHRGRGMTRSTL
jgi:hypothetical protein